MNDSSQTNECRMRKTAMGLSAWLSVFLALTLVLMLNFFSYRHGIRLKIEPEISRALSEKTLQILSNLDKELDIVVFFRPSNELYSRIRLMLREYEFASGNIRLVFVDPDRDIARTEDLSRRYDVSEANVIVFAAGNRKKIVHTKDMVEYDYTPMLSGSPKRIFSFNGEQAFSSAILEVTQEKAPVVYFLAGHGERKIDDYDRHKGCSGIARIMQRNSLALHTLVLGEAGRVPNNCDLLIVPGPRKTFLKAELDMISTYLSRGGRALFMFDSGNETGLEELLVKWGVQIGAGRVGGMTLTGYELLVTSYGSHPITQNLPGITTIFNMPRPVKPLDDTDAAHPEAADRPKTTVLAAGEWTEKRPYQNPPQFDPEKDIKGPAPVAVAIEKGDTAGMELQIKPTRLVVMGDSTMICNGALAAGYSTDMFMNAVNWLLNISEGIAIAPQTESGFRIMLTRSGVQSLFWILVVGIPSLAAILGIGVWLRRRK